jgi:pyroglutamyl-peptidase
MATVLVTGFEPFGGEAVNPSWEAAALVSSTVAGTRLERVLVPTTYEGGIETVTAAIDRYQPTAVLMVGQAGGRTELSIERIAINLDDTQAPDNAGVVREGTAIVADGPCAYMASLPLREMTARLHEAGVPAAISNTAGLFVCNHLFYGVLHYLAVQQLNITAGFVHVPFLPQQVTSRPGTPSMSLAEIVAGLSVIVDVLARQA